jgi:hypothetical protein
MGLAEKPLIKSAAWVQCQLSTPRLEVAYDMPTSRLIADRVVEGIEDRPATPT